MGGRPLRDMFEAVDHAKAYDYMFTLLGNKEIEGDLSRHVECVVGIQKI